MNHRACVFRASPESPSSREAVNSSSALRKPRLRRVLGVQGFRGLGLTEILGFGALGILGSGQP